MNRLALRGRVVAASLLVLSLGLATIGVGLNVLLTSQLSADADAVLRARADAQRATIDVVAGRVIVREGDQDEALDREAWVFANGGTLARPPAAPDLQREAEALSRVRTTTTRNVPGEVRLLAEPVRQPGTGDRIAAIVVGVSLGPYEHTERLARVGTVVFALFVLLAGAIIAVRAVGAGLRPVAEMARAAEDYSEHDLSRRFELGPVRDEITGLAATLDGLLDRLQASLSREQRLSAEIAHELRTPLSGIRGEAELAMGKEHLAADTRQSLESVVAGVDRLDAAVDSLLRAARHLDPSSATCTLEAALRIALDSNRAEAEQAGVALECRDTVPGARIAADARFVAQTLQPLIENAIRHAHSLVVIRGAPGASAVTVTIEDDGPGIAVSDAERIFEPGVQTAGGSGVGLGLALSRRLARSVGGDVTADSAAGGGGRLVVELPTVARGAT